MSGREGNKYIPKIERNKKEFIMKKKNVTDKHQPCIQLYIDQLSVRQFCFCSFFFVVARSGGLGLGKNRENILLLLFIIRRIILHKREKKTNLLRDWIENPIFSCIHSYKTNTLIENNTLTAYGIRIDQLFRWEIVTSTPYTH